MGEIDRERTGAGARASRTTTHRHVQDLDKTRVRDVLPELMTKKELACCSVIQSPHFSKVGSMCATGPAQVLEDVLPLIRFFLLKKPSGEADLRGDLKE